MIKGISSNNMSIAAYALSKGVSLVRQRRENANSSEVRAQEKTTKDTIAVLKTGEQGKNSQTLLNNLQVVQSKVQAYKPAEQHGKESSAKEAGPKETSQKHVQQIRLGPFATRINPHLGRMKLKVLPLPNSLFTQIWPLCASIMVFAIERPRPAPFRSPEAL